MTLRTRDCRDVVAANLAYHLSAGVDFVIVNDHRSVDGTREVLEEYEDRGLVHLIRRDTVGFVPGEWVDEMARLAVTRFDADWVLHADADEFWWPRGGDLKDVLRVVPERFGVVRGLWRHFAPRPEDRCCFAERMIVRVAPHGAWRGVEHTFHPNVKVAHRADSAIQLRPGNHDATTFWPLLRSWYPVEVLHFPLRTASQARARYAAWKPVLDAGFDIATHVDAAVAALDDDRFGDFYDRYVIGDEELAEGVLSGRIVVDTRLRDALRALAGNPGRPVDAGTLLDPRPGRLVFPAFDVAANASLADDASALNDSVDRAHDRADALEARLAACERRQLRSLVPRRTLAGS